MYLEKTDRSVILPMQGTLIAFAALSDQQEHIGMMRSAGLLSPIAFLNKVSSPLALGVADVFLAEVRP
jgi:lysosomal acid lipase/cholesteryl ester hydrolase